MRKISELLANSSDDGNTVPASVHMSGNQPEKTKPTVHEYGSSDDSGDSEPYTGTAAEPIAVPVYGNRYGFNVEQAIGLDRTSGDKNRRSEIRTNDYTNDLLDQLQTQLNIRDRSTVYRVAVIFMASGLLNDEEKS